MRFGLIVLAAMLLVLAEVSWAEEESTYDRMEAAQARIAELERENRALQAQVAMLRGELAHARAELEASKARPVPASPGASVSSDPASAAEPAPAARTGTLAADSPPRPAAVPVYSSLLPILRGLPTELKPEARSGGWDQYTRDKLRAHLATAYTGHRIETNSTVQEVRIGRNHDRTKNGDWKIEIFLEAEAIEFAGLRIYQCLGSYPWPVTLYGDETFARRAERLQKGHRIPLKGVIERIHTGLLFSHNFYVSFSQLELDAALLRR